MPAPDRRRAVSDITLLLRSARGGDRSAAEQVFALLYAELKRLARSRLAMAPRSAEHHTTVVAHEAMLRLWSADLPAFDSREHFLSYAARTMRSVVVDAARSRLAQRHGGDVLHVSLDTEMSEKLHAPDDEVLQVNEALDELAAAEPRLAQVVSLRYFAGLGDAEIAALLDVTERTVQRDWAKARLYLDRALRRTR